MGTYTDPDHPLVQRTSLLACRVCPDESTTDGEGKTSMAACICKRGFFHDFLLTDPFCRPCSNESTSCPDLGTSICTINLKLGWWRPSKSVSSPKSCRYSRVCIGGNVSSSAYDPSADSYCDRSRGVHGTYCTLCNSTSSYFSTFEQRCFTCAPATTTATILGYLLAFVCVYQLLIRWRWALALRLRIWQASVAISLGTKMKMLISTFQVLTQMGDVYHLEYPNSYQALLKGVTIANG